MSRDPLSRIASAAAGIADPAIAAYLLEFPAELLERLTGESNGVGISARRQIILAKRDEILRGITGYASIARLAKDIDAYWRRSWPRDRLGANHYQDGDNRAKFYDMFRLHPAPLSRSQVYAIVRLAPF